MCLRGTRERFVFMSGWAIERIRVRRGFYGAPGLDAFVYGKEIVRFCNGIRLLFAEDVSHAADLGADTTELFFEVFIAAIEVIDAVEDGFAVSDEGGEDERG